MEKVTFNSIVGFVLAVAFAIVMAICMNAVLAGDYMQPNSVMNDTTRNTLQIVGYAGGLAAKRRLLALERGKAEVPAGGWEPSRR